MKKTGKLIILLAGAYLLLPTVLSAQTANPSADKSRTEKPIVPQQLSGPQGAGVAPGGPVEQMPGQPPATMSQPQPQPQQQNGAETQEQQQPVPTNEPPQTSTETVAAPDLPLPPDAVPTAPQTPQAIIQVKALLPRKRNKKQAKKNAKKNEANKPGTPGAKPRNAETYISPAIAKDVLVGAFDNAETGQVEGFIHFSGTSTATDFMSIKAPFDGRFYGLKTPLYKWVEKGEEMGVLTSVEMAALMDVGASTITVRKRWGSVYDFEHIKAPCSGIVIKANVDNNQNIHENDTMFTIAQEFYIIGRTTERPVSPLMRGMPALVFSDEGIKGKGELDRFVQEGNTGIYRVRVKINTGDKSFQPGMVFTGDVFNPNNLDYARAPVNALIRRGGKTYIVLMEEVKTGERIGDYAELLSGTQPGKIFMYPRSLLKLKPAAAPAAEEKKAKPAATPKKKPVKKIIKRQIKKKSPPKIAPPATGQALTEDLPGTIQVEAIPESTAPAAGHPVINEPGNGQSLPIPAATATGKPAANKQGKARNAQHQTGTPAAAQTDKSDALSGQ